MILPELELQENDREHKCNNWQDSHHRQQILFNNIIPKLHAYIYETGLMYQNNISN